MIEPIMFVGLGFLAAALLALAFMPLVHARAVRLTRRRVEASTPMSISEIQADKDQLRAEFALSTRRLEMSVEQLRGKTTAQLSELGKKTAAMAALQAELEEKTAAVAALEASILTLRGQNEGSEAALAAFNAGLAETEAQRTALEVGLAKAELDLQESSSAADSQRVEVIALQTQAQMLKDRVATLEAEARHTQGELQTLRTEKTLVEGQLDRSRDDRARLQRDLSTLRREMESTWEQERSENALIRERINDVSAEVARLTMTLEGPDSPIEDILAEAGNGHGSASGRASLADRIRALQARSRPSATN